MDNKKSFFDNKIFGMMFNGGLKAFTILMSFINLLILVNALGDSKYGVWATILTIVSWFDLCDLGLGNGLRNRLTESIVKKDGRSKECVSSAYIFISTIVLFVGLIFVIIACFIDWQGYFAVDLDGECITAVILISIIWAAVNFISSLCKNILFALQKAHIVSGIGAVSQTINIILLLYFAKMGTLSLFTVAAIYGFSVFLVNAIVSICLFVRYNEYRPSIKSYNKDVARSTVSIGWKFFVLQGCALILFSTDSIIITMLFDASEVTPYSIIMKYYSILINIFAAMLAPIWSVITKEKIINGNKAVSKVIKQLLIVMAPVDIVAVLLMFLFPYLSAVMFRQQVEVSSLLIFLGMMYCIVSNWCNSCATITNGLSILNVPMVISAFQAIVNIPFSLFLVHYMGNRVEGVFAGTILTMIISGVLYPIVILRYLKSEQ